MKSPTKDGTMLDNVKYGKLVDHEVTYHCWSTLDNVKHGKHLNLQ